MLSSQNQKLDFICIGAAKSGTTTLHEILKDHPEISLPFAKEVPYFNEPELIIKGDDWYLGQNFNNPKDGSIWGTITPQYMFNRNGETPGTIAKRIKEHNKDAKIIAILRQPVERSFSHYKTAQRRVNASDSFEDAMTGILSNENISQMRQDDWEPVNLAFFGSEYYNLLKPYFDTFERENIKIYFMDDLIADTEKFIRNICKFIGVNQGFKPDLKGKNTNPGGSKPKIALLTPRYTHASWVRKIWHVFPYRFRKIVEVKVNSWNAKTDKVKLDKTTNEYKDLVEHFSRDFNKLEKIIHIKNPWIDI